MKGAENCGIMSFSGEYQNNIDAKGRVVIPIKFREQLNEGFVITKGLSHCAFVLPKADFEKIEEKLSGESFTNRNARSMQLFFIGSKIDGEFDAQGRVGLSQSLREFANLQKEVVVVGVGNRIEIWDKHTYEEFIDSFSDSDEFLDGIQDFEL